METRIRGTIKKTTRCKNVLERIRFCVSRILVIVKKFEHFFGSRHNFLAKTLLNSSWSWPRSQVLVSFSI